MVVVVGGEKMPLFMENLNLVVDLFRGHCGNEVNVELLPGHSMGGVVLRSPGAEHALEFREEP